ncbi:MAG: hypothetical protein ACO3QV_08110, partial [Candidatus Nanopelagicaceae bacterium]
ASSSPSSIHRLLPHISLPRSLHSMRPRGSTLIVMMTKVPKDLHMTHYLGKPRSSSLVIS